ncbi:MAG TPA: hypothetical protein VFL76_07255 [Edaphocola sp.]|nr:hypothetical protein [Edaphocola sp.]
MPYKKIGKIIQAQGISGRVLLLHHFSSGKPFLKLKHIFVALQEGSFIPFFPEQSPAVIDDGRVALQLDDIHSEKDAQILLGKNVFVEEEVFSKLFPETGILAGTELSGFRIKDANSGLSGIIETVIELPGQLMASVHFRDKEILIPLAENFIRGMDPGKKILELALPEGIWEL